ncbi:MAG: ABC transporter permease [Oscillospiraceae bacterium]|nr:ABC transporter permease [Oscillospiraceae bacterium]
MIALVQYTLLFASVLLLVALGGCFSERSGVINIGLEGIMVMGALGGALVLKYMPASVGGFVLILCASFAAALMGMLCALLLGVAAIRFRADQTLTGTAVNMLATAVATVGVKALNSSVSAGKDTTSDVVYTETRGLLTMKFGNLEISGFLIIALLCLAASYFALYKTPFGLRLRACGEHPQAADSAGISVSGMRYSGVLLSGVLGGFGGIAYITAGGSQWKFETGVGGFGFLAMALMIFGGWHPLRIALAAVLFGFFRALGNVYMGFDFLTNLRIPSVVYLMLPYVISLLVLTFSSKGSRAPKAAGIPYDKGLR